MIELLLIFIIVHWGWATGNILAVKTDWSITKFLVLILTLWTLTKSIG